jgi:hypothetical protein
VTLNYLKLANQILIEPIDILINVERQIMGIPTSIDFEVIDLVEGMPAYPTLIDRPWGRQMKAIISFERDRIKIKGSGRKINIPLDPKEGKLWMESWDEDQEAQCLYQIINEHRDYVEPNAQGEILTESPLLVRHNSDSTLYN